jgi:hypothetical protein
MEGDKTGMERLYESKEEQSSRGEREELMASEVSKDNIIVSSRCRLDPRSMSRWASKMPFGACYLASAGFFTSFKIRQTCPL